MASRSHRRTLLVTALHRTLGAVRCRTGLGAGCADDHPGRGAEPLAQPAPDGHAPGGAAGVSRLLSQAHAARWLGCGAACAAATLSAAAGVASLSAHQPVAAGAP